MATSSGSPKKSSSSSTASRPPNQGIKFARRTSSGRVVSLSRDDDLDMSGEFAGPNDYINYTVMMPPTPDNQPGADSETKADGGPQRRRTGDEEGGNATANGAAKMDRRVSVMKSSNNKSMLLRSQTGDFDHNRWLFETKGKYGIGNAFWSEEDDDYGSETGMSMSDFLDKPWKPLTRKVKIPTAILSPYRYIYIYIYDSFFFWWVRRKNKINMFIYVILVSCKNMH